MCRKVSTSDFCVRATKIHNNKYDYSLVNYTTNTTIIDIICPIHGIFNQKPASHLQGKGCKLCKNEKLSSDRRMDISQFITRSNTIHNNKYDYSKSLYVNAHTKLTIICPTHGAFDQPPMNHIKGVGCMLCGRDILSTYFSSNTHEFIAKANVIHNYKYNYSESTYIKSWTKITIICPIHGKFTQTPNHHLQGKGCPKCSESTGESYIRMWLEQNHVQYIQEKRFKDCKYKKSLPFDFYIPSLNICIEYDGEQHYKPTKFHKSQTDNNIQESFTRTQHNDSIKTKYCEDNNIKLIRIPYWDKPNISEILTTHLI